MSKISKIKKLIVNKRVKPKFLGLGVAKAGTTTIAGYLSQHPDIYIPKRKELHFFDRESVNFLQKELYLREFKEGKCNGEFTPSYMLDPKARDNILDLLGVNVKFIVSLRNPMERAFSHYCHALNHWHKQKYRRLNYPVEDLCFEDAIVAETERLNLGKYHIRHQSYFTKGLYYQQLVHYFERFPKENFKIVIFDDLKNNELSIVNEIVSFLGLDNSKFIKTNSKRNSQTNKVINNDTYNMLVDMYIHEVEKLEDLINRDLTLWKKYK